MKPPLTPEQKIIELAKLDGFDEIHFSNPRKCLVGYLGVDLLSLPPYLTSYDAIIPLIQKQKWAYQCETMIQLRIAFQKRKEVLPTINNTEGWMVMPIKATPLELADALLKAHGFEI